MRGLCIVPLYQAVTRLSSPVGAPSSNQQQGQGLLGTVGRSGLGPTLWGPGANAKHRPPISFSSKTALLEGLEVDQYMWGILNAIQQ